MILIILDSISKRSVIYREDQWEEREIFIKNIKTKVILDCMYQYNKNLSVGRANLLTFCLGMERTLGQKFSINLFPLVDFNEGKILVIKPFSVYEVDDNGPEIKANISTNKEMEESAWNFYDSSRRPSMQIPGGIPENIQGDPSFGFETYEFRKNQEDALIRQMVGKLRENYPPKEFFYCQFVKKNFFLIPGKSRRPSPNEKPLFEMNDDLEILKKMASFMDDFVPIDDSKKDGSSDKDSEGSEYAISQVNPRKLEDMSPHQSPRYQEPPKMWEGNQDNKELMKEENDFMENINFAFSDSIIKEKLNNNLKYQFINVFPTIFTKFCAKQIGTYNQLFKCNPVELFRVFSRAILVKDLTSLVNTNPKDIQLFPDFMNLPEETKKLIEEYTRKSKNPRLLLDEYFLLRDQYNSLMKDSSGDQKVIIQRAEIRSKLEIIKPFKAVLEDMNLCLNLVHFMKTQIENGNCLVVLGSPKQLHYIRAIKGTNRQVEDMYIILENYEKKEFVFSFDLHKYHYAFFIYLHSSMTLEENMMFQLGTNFYTED